MRGKHVRRRGDRPDRAEEESKDRIPRRLLPFAEQEEVQQEKTCGKRRQGGGEIAEHDRNECGDGGHGGLLQVSC